MPCFKGHTRTGGRLFEDFIAARGSFNGLRRLTAWALQAIISAQCPRLNQADQLRLEHPNQRKERCPYVIVYYLED